MAIEIEKTIDLTAYEGNPDPKVTEQLCIAHEARDGEIVQYYIDLRNRSERDKNSHAVGVYDEDQRLWTTVDYEELEWTSPISRVSGNRLEHMSVKTFPNVGSIAVYKLMHRNISRIMAPVNPEDQKKNAPVLDAWVEQNGDVGFTITPPEEPEYDCYRIVMRAGEFSTDHIVYELTGTVEPPMVSGRYEIFAIGYHHEAQVSSNDSNAITLTLSGKEDTYEPPYYTKSAVKELIQRIEQLEADMGDAVSTLSSIVEVPDVNP